MIELNPLCVQHVYPKLTQEVSADHKLMIFELASHDLATVRAWMRQVSDALRTWPAGYPCLLIYDFHKCGRDFLTADLHEEFKVLHQVRPDLERYAALILPPNADVGAVRLAIQARDLGVSSRYPIHWDLFTHRKYALAWLMSKDR